MEKVDRKVFSSELTNLYFEIFHTIQYELGYYWEKTNNLKVLEHFLVKLKTYLNQLQGIHNIKMEEIDNIR